MSQLNLQSITRGDRLEPCDICEQLQFDVETINTGGHEPWNWDCQAVCLRCRFSEAIRVAKETVMMERWYQEEQAWLEGGGQAAIDSESNSNLISPAQGTSDKFAPMSQEDVVAEAEALLNLKRHEWMYGEKFISVLAYALYALSLDGGYEDEFLQESGGGSVTRISRWFMMEAEDGTVSYIEFEAENAAQAAFASLFEEEARNNH